MSDHSSKGAIFKAAIANIGIAIAKFIGAGLTGSAAMVAEGIHSLVDVGNQGLILLGMSRSTRNPDAKHPLGYGKEMYFWSFLVAMLIFAIGATVSFYEGFHKLMDPSPLEHGVAAVVAGFHIYFYHIVLAILMFGFLLEGWSMLAALDAFAIQRKSKPFFEAIRESKDPAVVVVLFEDAAALIGLGIAFVGISLAYYFDSTAIDAITSMVIGGVLGVTSIFLAMETKGLLIGEAATEEVVAKVNAIIRSHIRDGIDNVNEVVTYHAGPDDLIVLISLDMDDSMGADDVENLTSWIERDIKKQINIVRRVFVEAQSIQSHKKDIEAFGK